MNLPQWLSITLLVITSLIQLTGFLGLFLVFFPGLTVIWIGQLMWVISIGFNQAHEPWQYGWTIAIFVINTVLMVVGSILDNVFMAGSAYKKGAPWWVIALSWLGMIIGGILFTPIGGLAVALLVLFFAEYLRVKDEKQAFESTKGMVMGCGWAVAARVALALLMLMLWLIVLVWL